MNEEEQRSADNAQTQKNLESVIPGIIEAIRGIKDSQQLELAVRAVSLANQGRLGVVEPKSLNYQPPIIKKAVQVGNPAEHQLIDPLYDHCWF